MDGFLPREDGFYRLTGGKPGDDPYEYRAFLVEKGILYCWANRYCDWGWMSGWPVEAVERLLHPVRLTWEQVERLPKYSRNEGWASVIRAFVATLSAPEVLLLRCDDPEWEERQNCGPSGRPFVADLLPFDRETGTVFPVAQFTHGTFRGQLHWAKLMQVAGVRFVDTHEAMLAVCRRRG